MSQYKLKLNQIREVLGMPVKFETVKLKDGTAVEVEKLEIGFPVMVVAEDGSKTPAPEGSHILEDGTEIEVDANGVISEISAPETEVETEETATVPVAMAEETVTEETKVTEEPIKDDAYAKIEEKMSMLFAAITECAEEISKVKEDMGALKTKMEKFSKAPAGVKIPKTTEIESKYDAVEARVAALKNLRSDFVK